MGVRNYYCDFCERSFLDSPYARKMHLRSVKHIKLRKAYYQSCRDPEVILAEESVKLPCNRYHKNGDCMFGASCKFSHFTEEQLQLLQEQINTKKVSKSLTKASVGLEEPSLSSWLEKRSKTLVNVDEESNVTKQISTWHLPSELQGRLDLPPSLREIKVEYFINGEFSDWGS